MADPALTRRQILAASLPAAVALTQVLGAEKTAAKPALIAVAEATRLRERLTPLHEKKRPNQAGDWLASHKEAGQTFDQYLKAHPKRVCEEYRTLYLQPLGELSPAQQAVVKQTADCMERFFGMPLTMNTPITLDGFPAHARRTHPTWDVPQVLSTHLLNEVLKPRRPRDAAAMLGLTASDLWPGEGWNFVFGQASLGDRVGVWSVYRNGNLEGSQNERRMFLRRTLKTALHETGHMLGIPHCTRYECGMNGSNSLPESDRQPIEFCPECQAKVWWTCDAAPLARVEKLIEFAEKHGFTDETAKWKKAREALK